MVIVMQCNKSKTSDLDCEDNDFADNQAVKVNGTAFNFSFRQWWP